MKTRKRRSGIVLFAVLATMLALALLAGTLAVLATSDIRMTAHFKRAVDALYATDAGVQNVKAAIERDLASGALVLDSAVETVNYTAPDGFDCDTVTRLVRAGDTNAYMYSVVGRALESKVAVEIVFRRGSVFDLGLFGDKQLDVKAYGNVYAYDSRQITNPTAEDSIGGATLASNGDFLSHQDTFIDGSFELGESALGTPGSWRETPEGGTIVHGEPAVDVERIDPDPLGAIGGDLADDFIYYSDPKNNNDAEAIPPIVRPKFSMSVKNGEELILPSGNYYIDDLIIFNGATLTVKPDAGPVNIYLTGKFEAKEGSTVNAAGDPTDLSIYSNSDDPIILKHDGDFKGLVYAPYAQVEVKNSGDFHGVAWGEYIEIKNSGDVFIDVALMNEYPNNKIKLLSWKEIRD